jgi:hypothetical protein
VLQRLEKERELMEEQRVRREAAAGANCVMEPVARRKLRKEVQKVRRINPVHGLNRTAVRTSALKGSEGPMRKGFHTCLLPSCIASAEDAGRLSGMTVHLAMLDEDIKCSVLVRDPT